MTGLTNIILLPRPTHNPGIKTFLLFILVIIQLCVKGQQYTDQFNLKTWGDNDGLSLAFKNTMVKDRKGFLWITSPLGINKFDGGKFKIYHSQKDDTSKPNSSYSFSAIEDSLHNLWIGTNKGLVYYLLEKEQFGNVYPKITSYATITTMIPFGGSKDEIFCIESATYITGYNIRTHARRQIAEISGNLTLKNNLATQSATYDPVAQKIWILKGDQSGADEGLISIDIHSGNISYFNWPCLKKQIAHQHLFRGMCIDVGRRKLWINSSDGLLNFDLNESSINSSHGFEKVSERKDYSNSVGVSLDRSNNVWVATNSDGILIYKPEQEAFEPLFSDREMQLNSGQSNTTIYFDNDNMVWLGYAVKKNMVQLIKQQPAVKLLTGPGINSNELIRVNDGGPGKFIISTTRGIQIVDKATLKIKDFNHAFQLQNIPGDVLLYNNIPLTVAWIFNHQNNSLRRTKLYSGETHLIQFPNTESAPAEATIVPVLTKPFKDGFVMMADNQGVYQLRLGESAAVKIIPVPYHVTNLEICNEEYIFIRLHFTAKNLCYRYNGSEWKLFPNPIDSINWSCVNYDSKTETFWVGELRELSQYDKNFRLVKKYSSDEGMNLNDILDIKIDAVSNVWFINQRGQTFLLVPGSGTITELSEKDGYNVKSINWLPPTMMDSTGIFYVPGNNGLSLINTNMVRRFPPPSIYISQFSINQKPVQKIFDNTSLLTLNHKQTSISFEVGILNFYDQEHSRIRYKMVGTSDNWQTIQPGQTIQYNKLSSGKYTFIVQASSSGNNFDGKEKIIRIEIKPAIWQTIPFWILLVLIVTLSFYLLLRNSIHQRYKQKLDVSKKEKLLAEMKQRTHQLEQQALSLEMQVLRTQMNPHFIFNSLNSVNRFILQNNTSNASSYLTKFSKLIRMILQHSQEQQITLENELEALNLYLELESVRFENRFNYKITVQPSLDISEVMVPPLIMQPYIENAIWHGLMHKETKGQLDLEITAEGKSLYMCITDDGVGREKAVALENNSQGKFKSFGMRITQERITAMGKESEEASVNISDLTNPDGTPAGTEVTIKIPLVYD